MGARGTGALHTSPYQHLTARGIFAQTYQRETFVRLIAERRIALDGMEILDVGCRTGSWCRFFAEIKGTTDGILGIDLSTDRLGVARLLSRINYKPGDMTQLTDVIDRRFDFVSAFVSLMFLDGRSELHSVCSSVHHLLRPGGYFFVCEREERNIVRGATTQGGRHQRSSRS